MVGSLLGLVGLVCCDSNDKSSSAARRTDPVIVPDAGVSPVEGERVPNAPNPGVGKRKLADIVDIRNEPPERLVSLLNANKENPDPDFNNRFAEFLSEIPDLTTLEKYLNGLEPAQYKELMLQRVFKDSPLTIPSNLARLELLCKSDLELRHLGEAISLRLKHLPPDSKWNTIQEFLDQASANSITSLLVGDATADLVKSDIGKAREWLLTLGPEVNLGDAVIGKAYGRDPESGVDYIQQLINDGKTERAGEAIIGFALSYSKSAPRDAFDWAMQLPAPLVEARSQALNYALGAVFRENRTEAESRVSAVADPKTRDLLNRFLQGFRKQADGS